MGELLKHVATRKGWRDEPRPRPAAVCDWQDQPGFNTTDPDVEGLTEGVLLNRERSWETESGRYSSAPSHLEILAPAAEFSDLDRISR
ncbi:MAG: hypothetical protein DRJ50_04405 [Actinobacteria bacterium]|nr:MAG: hypothetical protein DRJ50_04405 [Actinomycetota bacterium]